MTLYTLALLFVLCTCALALPRVKDEDIEKDIKLLRHLIERRKSQSTGNEEHWHESQRNVHDSNYGGEKRLRGSLNQNHYRHITSLYDLHKRKKDNQLGRGQGLRDGFMLDTPKNIDADSFLEDILEGEVIENGKTEHRATGTKPRQKKKLKGENGDHHLSVSEDDIKRNFVTKTSRYWTKGIVPFEIDPSAEYTVEQESKIYQAIKQFDDLTCVRWVDQNDSRNTEANLGHDSYVKIVSKSGCSSYVGNVAHLLKKYNYTYQPLSLAKPGCVWVSIAVHEMLHALGAHHEQSRTDSDKYIEIIYKNIAESQYPNFNLYATTDKHAYDGSSVLQYSLRAFSSNGGQTIRFKDWRLEFLANIADGLMFYDVLDVNTAYNCAGNCTSIDCQNAGFINWKCECYCPDVLEGTSCEDTKGNCGETINVAAGEEVYITTPNYPSNYDTGLQCVWLIQGVPNNILRGTIVDMDISNNDNACYHWVEFRYNLLGQTGPKRCGKTQHEVWDASEDEFKNKMIVLFDSFVSSDKATSRGLKMKFESIGTGCMNHPCVFGSCYSPINTATFICTCNQGFTGTNCDVLTDLAVVGCTAEVGDYCMLKQEETLDEFDFDFGSGTTRTSSIGPHNAKEGFIYLYAKSSYHRKKGDRAMLYTDLALPSVDRCLRFWFHMYGSSMGTLNVNTNNSAGEEENIFTRSGNQGDLWQEAAIFIKATNGLKVIFEGIMSTSYSSDMAIDDIWLIPGTCDEPLTAATTSTTTATTSTTSATTTSTTSATTTSTTPTTTSSTPSTTSTTPSTTSTTPSTTSTTPSTTSTTPSTTSTTPSTTSTTPSTTSTTPSTTSTTPSTTSTTPSTTSTTPSTTSTTPSTTSTTPSTTSTTPSTTSTTPSTTSTTPSTTSTTPSTTSTTPSTTSATPSTTSTTTTQPADCATAKPCENGGTCITNTDGTYSPCTCTSGWTGEHCSIIDKTTIQSMTCDFETVDGGCLFDDIADDDFDWTRNSGTTKSSSTGPSSAASGSYYIYTEASSPRVPDDEAIISTALYQLPSSFFCMELSYHMRGSPGSLIVSAGERGSAYNQIMSIDGNQGDGWHSTRFNIPQYSDAVIQIKGTRGTTTKGDIAVDDISLSLDKCNPCDSSPCQNGAQCSSNIDAGTFVCTCPSGSGWIGDLCTIQDRTSGVTFTCDFEADENECVFHNTMEDIFNWTVYTDKTPSGSTGPNKAFNGMYYIYTEASLPRQPDDNAIFDTSQFKLADSDFCLKYSYHMYSNPGDLIVYAGERSATPSQVETFSGNQEEHWHTSIVQIPQYSDTVISFEGTIGSNSKGDIGLDLIRLQKGLCTDPCGSFPCLNGGSCTNQIDTYVCSCKSGWTGSQCQFIDLTSEVFLYCDFEDTGYTCPFDETTNDIFDWRLRTGSTYSSGTGPTEAFTGLYYKYTEASSPRVQGDNAILDTSNYKLAATPYCLDFAYHMKGHPGDLIISAGERNGNMQTKLTISGDQGNNWLSTFVHIPQYSDVVISITGTIGSSWKGDIAIDDISMESGGCNACDSYPCLNGGQCSSTIAEGTFVCTCPSGSGWTGDLCDIEDVSSDLTFTCDFETSETGCIFHNAMGDNFDWTVYTGKTPSYTTGPNEAYSGRYYIYTEASSRTTDDNAIFDTSTYKLADSPYCLKYSYHMYSNPGDLILYAGERSATPSQVEIFSGNQGEQWHTSIVQIPQYSDTVIAFDGTIGPDSKGDIGLDLIRLQKGLCTDPCGSFPCLNGAVCTNQLTAYTCSCKPGYTGSQCQLRDLSSETFLYCEFEETSDYECPFDESTNDVFDWTLKSGSTSSSGTGPTEAYAGLYYKYTEASSPRVQGNYAILDTSNYILADSPYCLDFAFHMQGNPGDLIISAGERNGNMQTELTLSGDQGSQWNLTYVDIPQYSDVVISIKGTRGPSYKGDIAVDDIMIWTGTCAT